MGLGTSWRPQCAAGPSAAPVPAVSPSPGRPQCATGPGDTWGRPCPRVPSYVMRMKEFERERRLLQRQKRLRQREEAATAE